MMRMMLMRMMIMVMVMVMMMVVMKMMVMAMVMMVMTMMMMVVVMVMMVMACLQGAAREGLHFTKESWRSWCTCTFMEKGKRSARKCVFLHLNVPFLLQGL